MSLQLTKALLATNYLWREEAAGVVLGTERPNKPPAVISIEVMLADALVAPTMQYSAGLARTVRHREVAATVMANGYKETAADESQDQEIRLLAQACARELFGVIKAIHAVDMGVVNAEKVFDGPV
jgi:hypothetical protein